MPNTYETKLWGGRFRGDEDALMQHFNSECWRTSWLVEPLAMAAIAAGCDGLIIEVHNDPPHAKCDGQQSLTPKKFDELMKKVEALVPMMGKKLIR